MKWRKWHRVVSILIFLPLSFVALTGFTLLLRNQFEWIQPKTVSLKNLPAGPLLTYEQIQSKFKPNEIEQIIYRPSKNNIAVRLKDGMEVQLHPQTGEELKRAMRRTAFLINLHQGTWLGSFGQYGLYLPTSVGLIFLILSGLIIYPFKRKRKNI